VKEENRYISIDCSTASCTEKPGFTTDPLCRMKLEAEEAYSKFEDEGTLPIICSKKCLKGIQE